MISRLSLASVGVFAFVAAASAADIYVSPAAGGYKDAPLEIPSWAGFYAGVNGGYGWGGNDNNISLENYADINKKNSPIFHVPGRTPDGGFGGGQIGYNWQPLTEGGYKDSPVYGHLLFGIEADIQGTSIGDDYTAKIVEFNYPANVKTNLDYFGTVRGRLGYAWDATLPYITGGFAYGGVNSSVFDSTGALKYNNTLTGYAVGAGIERKVTPNLSFKVEYLYINLGDYHYAYGTGSANQTVSGNIEADFHTIRFGLNYYIGTTYEPLK